MKVDIFDKDFNITKLTKVGDLVAAFIMKLHESSARYNGENFYILKDELKIYLKDSNDWLPSMLNDIFGLTKLNLSDFEFERFDPNTKIFEDEIFCKLIENKRAKKDYVYVGKLRKFLNEKYKKYDK